MNEKGKLILIPNTLGAEDISTTIPSNLSGYFENIKIIFVENPKMARQLIIGLGLKEKLDQFELISIKQGYDDELKQLTSETIHAGLDVGVLSDAGLPAIADPGNEIVWYAHKLEARVIPLSGPSSILMALMASGFNGQNFAFQGYLPKEINERGKKIKELERLVYSNSQTQIFIETPYRNQYLFDDLLSHCQKNTKICLAVNLTHPDEYIGVKTSGEWKNTNIDIQKKQCIFLIYK